MNTFRDRRKALGLTQRNLGELAGVCQKTVSSFELGNNVDNSTRRVLLDALHRAEVEASE